MPHASFAQASAGVDPSPIAIVISDAESAVATLFSWLAAIIPHANTTQTAAVAASQPASPVTNPSAVQPAIASATTTVVTNTVIEKETPIIEYIPTGSPTVSALSDPRVTSLITIVSDLAVLMQKVGDQSQNTQTFTPQNVAGNGTGLSAASNIGQLSNTTISNPTISGGSITAASVIGTIGNAINTAIATIDNLTATTITATNVTFTNATTTNATSTTLAVTGSANFASLTATGTSTLGNVILTNDNCASYGNGGKLTTDAFGDVICAPDQSGGAGSTVAGSNGQIQFNGNGSLAAVSAFTYATSTNTLTVGNASTTLLSASNFSATNGSIASLTTTGATSTNFFATTASSTNLFAQTASVGTLFANSLTLTTALPVASGGTGATSLSGLITTADLASSNISQFTNDAGYVTSSFSTTSAAYWQSQNNFFSTTSASVFLALNQGNAFSTTSANYLLGTKGYLTSLSGAASSTLLGDNNTFSGTDTFTNAITASITGNAGTATTLQNARTINNVSFNGGADITIAAASSTVLGDANTWTGINAFTNAASDFSGTWQTHAPSYFQTALGFTPYNATNPSAFIPLTALSATYPLSYNSATGVFSSATSSATSAGILSAADWTTFNNKGNGTVTGVTATYPLISSGGTAPVISTALSSSTLTASSPLTGSFAQVGTGGSLGIQPASASQAGYLSAGDYSLLHTATTTFSSPLTYTGSTNAVTCPTCNTTNATVSSVGLSSSGSITVGNTPVTTSGTITANLNLANANNWTGLQQFTNATSTLFTSTNAYLGTVLGGTWNGTAVATAYGGTGANFSSGNGLAAINAGVFSAISTTSMNASITGNAGTATALQNAQTINNVSFNGTAGITITAASSTLLSDNNTFTGKLVLGSATSTNFFSTTASSTNLFAQTASLGTLTLSNALPIASGGTGATIFGQGGISSSGGTNALAASTSPTVNYITATSPTATSTIAGGFSAGGTGLVYNWGSGWTGVGTANPARLFNIFGAAANPQERISYSSTAYTELQTDAAGDYLIAPTSGIVEIANGNIEVCSNSVCATPTVALSGAGNFSVENRLVAGSIEESCPSGYIWVPGESKYGTLPGFCTMQYVASQSGSTPVSAPGGTPWVNISQTSAIADCHAIGPGYHLMTDPEWMTIADETTALPINDLTGSQQFGTGASDSYASAGLTAGDAGTNPVVSGCNWMKPLSDASNAYVASSCELRGNGTGGTTDADKGYYATGSTFSGAWSDGAAGRSQLRTKVLPNGAVIWDMGGNIWQWTDAYEYGSNEGPTPVNAWTDYSAVTNYQGLNIRPDISTWNAASNGIGQIYSSNTATVYGFVRGGAWSTGARDGVFTLGLYNSPGNTDTNIGFRCSR